MNTARESGQPRIAIVGGGIMGVTLAYLLRDLPVTVYERGSNLGGLAACMEFGGARIDRFYHTILSSDLSMQGLIKEAGVDGKLHFTATKQGFYDRGKLYPFNTPVDLMRYPPLNVFQRFRLGLQVLYAQVESDWRKIDQIPVRDWLIRLSGRAVYNKVWAPLLRAKFDSTASDVPATYIWSRLRRMLGTRQGVTSKEMMCYLEDGYYTLIEGLASLASADGVDFRLNAPIEGIVIEDGVAVGIRSGGQFIPYDIVISTLPSPILADMLPDAPETFRARLTKQAYLSVLCPLLILDRSLMPYYVLNITDPSIPFTAVVETTNLIDPQHVGGNHLVYLPKYLAPGGDMARWPDEQVRVEWLKSLRQMFPAFDEVWIRAFILQRARYVEPIRPIGTLDDIPTIQTPVKRLYMGNTAMFYPELGNGEAATQFARKIEAQLRADLANGSVAPTPVHERSQL